MKKRSFVMASLLVLFSMAATQTVQAQQPMVVSIPFAFVAGNVTLPAGEYRVETMDRNSAILLIRCSDLNASAIVITFAAQGKELNSESKLVFNRYDNRYFLAQVWTAGSLRGRELLKSPREKEVAQSARLETKGQITLVARLSPARP
jgi:membrane-bound lytic murein transglycosylase